jgi:hypothetical protein
MLYLGFTNYQAKRDKKTSHKGTEGAGLYTRKQTEPTNRGNGIYNITPIIP